MKYNTSNLRSSEGLTRVRTISSNFSSVNVAEKTVVASNKTYNGAVVEYSYNYNDITGNIQEARYLYSAGYGAKVYKYWSGKKVDKS